MQTYVFMTLNERRGWDREAEWLRAVAEVAPVIDGVIVTSWCPPEDPRFLEYDMVRRMIDEIQNQKGTSGHALDVILGSDVFPRHDPKLFSQVDQFNAARYANVLARLHANAARVGAVATWAYTEPHAHSPHTAENGGFQRGFTPEGRMLVADAVRQAVLEVGPATFVDPGGKTNLDHWSWAFRGLGELAVHRGTYRLADPAEYIPAAPPGYPDEVTACGWWLTTDPANPKYAKYGDRPPLTVEQYAAIDWPAWETAFPDLCVRMIYARSEEKAAVMYKLGELAV